MNQPRETASTHGPVTPEAIAPGPCLLSPGHRSALPAVGGRVSGAEPRRATVASMTLRDGRLLARGAYERLSKDGARQAGGRCSTCRSDKPRPTRLILAARRLVFPRGGQQSGARATAGCRPFQERARGRSWILPPADRQHRSCMHPARRLFLPSEHARARRIRLMLVRPSGALAIAAAGCKEGGRGDRDAVQTRIDAWFTATLRPGARKTGRVPLRGAAGWREEAVVRASAGGSARRWPSASRCGSRPR